MATTLDVKLLCAYESCEQPAKQFACGRDDSYRKVKGHPDPAWYCDKHAGEVMEENNPEYIAYCPNCNCGFGVN